MRLVTFSHGAVLAALALGCALALAGPADAQPLFGARTDLAVGDLPRAVALADLNHDGHLDLVTALEGDSFVGVFLGNGDGTFGPRSEVPTDAGPRAIAIADWNGDGEPDLLVAASSVSRIAAYLGQGDGTFTPGADVAVPGPPTRLVPADLDGDGRLDVAAPSDFGNTRLFFVRGAPGGGFGARTDLDSLGGTQSYGVAIGQFDGGGAPDLFLPLVCGTCPSRQYNGLGGGGFASPIAIPGPNRPHGAVPLDYDGDGLTDVAISEPGAAGSPGVRLLHSTGGGLVAGPLIRTSSGATGIALGPWGGANESDLVVTCSTASVVSLVRVRCDGLAPSVYTAQVGQSPIDVAIGDVDEDGTADVVVANRNSGTVSILHMIAPESTYSCVRQADVAPPTLDFGPGALGVTSQLSAVVHSTGTVAVTITGASFSGDPAFQLLNPVLPVSIPPGTSRVVLLAYNRTSLGSHSGVFTLSTNDPAHPTLTVSLSGSTHRPVPVASVSPDTLKFGSDLTLNTTTLAATFTNTGEDTLILKSPTIDNSQFSYLGPLPEIHVTPGFSTLVNVRYNRTLAGPASGTFQVTTNDSLHPTLTVALTGFAIPRQPVVQFDVTTLDFGTDLVGNAKTLPIVVHNIGTLALSVSTVSIEGSEFAIVGPAGPVTIQPAGSATFSVRCVRSVPGVATGVFHVASDDPVTPDATVQLTAVSNEAPAITASAPPPATAAVGASVTVPVVVRNSGLGPLSFTPSTYGTDLVETSGYDGPAAPTPVVLTGAAGDTWDIRGNGSIGHGATGEYAGGMTLAAFLSLPTAAIGVAGREVRLGPIAFPAGLLATRKIYVPTAGGHARFCEVLENPGETPAVFTVDVADTIGFPPPDLPTTSSGNGSFTIDDTWLVFPPDLPVNRRAPGRVSALAGAAHTPSSSEYTTTLNGAFSRVRYGVTVPPHGRVVVASWAIQETDLAAGVARAAELALAPAWAFDGMSAIDRASTWNAPAVPSVFHTTGATWNVPPGDSAVVPVVCDAAAANLPAHVEGMMRFASNDPAHPVISVPLTFDITALAAVGVDPRPGGDVAPGRLALAGFVPNPAARGGSFRVAYTLASDAPAVITFYDLRGRVLARQTLATPAPGPGSIALTSAAGTRLAAGMIWIRLEQAGRSVTRKGIILP